MVVVGCGFGRRDDGWMELLWGNREKPAVPGFHKRRRKEVAKAGGRAEPFIYTAEQYGSLNECLRSPHYDP
jgi:hypothetical protein